MVLAGFLRRICYSCLAPLIVLSTVVPCPLSKSARLSSYKGTKWLRNSLHVACAVRKASGITIIDKNFHFNFLYKVVEQF